MARGISASRPRYVAFLSYRHRFLPQFVQQFELALKQYAKPLLKPPIKIFRDENYLVPGVDLPRLIRSALRDSEFLVLLASPEAAASEWVRDELRYWCGTLERTKNLIIVLLDGEIACTETKEVDWDRTDALPPVLRDHLQEIPYYVDMRWAVHDTSIDPANAEFKRAINLIVARLRNLDPNDLLGVEVLIYRRNMRLRNLAMGILVTLTLASLAATWYAFDQKRVAALERDSAEARRRAAVMTTAAGKIDQGYALAAYNLTRADEGLPAQFRRNVALGLFETGVVVEARALSNPEDFDVDELLLSATGNPLISQGWYNGAYLIDVTARNRLSACGDSRFKSMSLSPSAKSLVLQDEESVQLRNTTDCAEKSSFAGRITASTPVDGPLGMIVGMADGRLYRRRADGKSLEPFYEGGSAGPSVAILTTSNGELMALKSSRDVLRLINPEGVMVAPELHLVKGRFLKTDSPQWSAFARGLPAQSRARLITVHLGAGGSKEILAFFPATNRQTWVGLEKSGTKDDYFLAARLARAPRDGCTWLEWLTPTHLHRTVADRGCLEKGDSPRQELALPVAASSGAFCGPDDPWMLGTWDGAILWAREKSFGGTIGIEHVERSWTDSIRGLTCDSNGTAYAGFRATGIKRYKSRIRVVTESVKISTRGPEARPEPDTNVQWRLKQPVEGATMLQLLGESGTLQLSNSKQSLWTRQVARTTPYRTGSVVDRVDGVAIDEVRARVWVLTSTGTLVLLDLYTGVPLANVETSYWAASAGMNVAFSGLRIAPDRGDVTFTYGDSWQVDVLVEPGGPAHPILD